MLNKILDPLKLFFIGAIVAALIVLGFQLGKETDKGLLEYLRQDNAALQAELEKLRSENSALQAEKVRMQQEVTRTEETKASPPAEPSSPASHAVEEEAPEKPVPGSAPVINQIVDTFSPASEESRSAEPAAETQQ